MTEQIVEINVAKELLPEDSADYGLLLARLGIPYQEKGIYLEVGMPVVKQGWLLDICVITNQLAKFIPEMVAVLQGLTVPFVIARNKEAASDIIIGGTGWNRLGRVIVVYPANDEECFRVAKELVTATGGFRSPDVPTDYWLGGTVYTRYDVFDAVREGEIPFQLPAGKQWPFEKLTTFVEADAKKILNNAYRIVDVIKQNPKGDAYKAIYYKNIFNMGHCFIKQGRANAFTDDVGRDIKDRLEWQYKVHKCLSGMKGIPKVIDFFTEGKDVYLVFELIKGKPWLHTIADVFGYTTWRYLSQSVQLEVLDLILQISGMIAQLHSRGFIHRDIMPENFLVNSKKIVMIDLELSYNTREREPEPPFATGTVGFMSPAQSRRESPVFADDMYSLGALLFNAFLDLSPAKVSTDNIGYIATSVFFFTGSHDLARLISACFSIQPNERPDIQYLMKVIMNYRLSLQKMVIVEDNSAEIDKNVNLKEFNVLMIRSICSSLMANLDKIWTCSIRSDKKILGRSESRFYYLGLYDGISGVLLMLAEFKKAGIDISIGLDYYQTNFHFLISRLDKDREANGAGMFYGNAGIALAICAGMRDGVIPENESLNELIVSLLIEDTTALSIADGVAGKGLAVLYCLRIRYNEMLYTYVKQIAFFLKEQQLVNGAWDVVDKGDGGIAIALFDGVSGIVYFLCTYIEQSGDTSLLTVVEKGMQFLLTMSVETRTSIRWLYGNAKQQRVFSLGSGDAGLLLCFAKAYEVSKNKKFLEVILKMSPQLFGYQFSYEFDVAGGMAGIGFVCLELFRITNNPDYLIHAQRLGKMLVYSCKYYDNMAFYVNVHGGGGAFAGLLDGNSGLALFFLNLHKAIFI